MNSRGNSRLSSISRVATLYALIKHFSHRQRLFLMPLLLILLLCGIVLILTGGLSYVAPLMYAAF